VAAARQRQREGTAWHRTQHGGREGRRADSATAGGQDARHPRMRGTHHTRGRGRGAWLHGAGRKSGSSSMRILPPVLISSPLKSKKVSIALSSIGDVSSGIAVLGVVRYLVLFFVFFIAFLCVEAADESHVEIVLLHLIEDEGYVGVGEG
jgi:hypothetical protein